MARLNRVTFGRRAYANERYVLNIGFPGCLPENQDIFTTYADARAGVEWWKAAYREADCRVVGKHEDGVWEIYRENDDYPYMNMTLDRQSFTEEELAEIDAEY